MARMFSSFFRADCSAASQPIFLSHNSGVVAQLLHLGLDVLRAALVKPWAPNAGVYRSESDVWRVPPKQRELAASATIPTTELPLPEGPVNRR